MTIVAIISILSARLSNAMLRKCRTYTNVKSVITRPLQFDYSGPVATAFVNLQDPPEPPSYLDRLSQVLGYKQSKGSMTQHASVPRNYMHTGSNKRRRTDKSYPPNQQQQHDYNTLYYTQRDEYERQYLSAAHHESDPTEIFGGLERALPPGQAVTASVSLDLPVDHIDLFQITVELLSCTNQMLSKVSRAHVPKRQPLTVQVIK